MQFEKEDQPRNLQTIDAASSSGTEGSNDATRDSIDQVHQTLRAWERTYLKGNANALFSTDPVCDEDLPRVMITCIHRLGGGNRLMPCICTAWSTLRTSSESTCLFCPSVFRLFVLFDQVNIVS